MASMFARSVIACLLITASAAAAQTATERCHADRLRHASTHAGCRIKALSRAVLDGGPAIFQRCDARLARGFAATAARYGTACPGGDLPAAQAVLADCAEQVGTLLAGGAPGCRRLTATGQTGCWDPTGVAIACAGSGQDGEVQAGAALAYADNGDGTITDLATGLMWEKKGDDGGIHDRDQRWNWQGGFDQFVAQLNADGFAGYDDWRVPNVKELQSIVNYGVASPSVDPAFHHDCAPGCAVTACSCTLLEFYWTSTSHVLGAGLARLVNFEVGSVVIGAKVQGLFPVRAVRGGT
jgi:hypothetical protein